MSEQRNSDPPIEDYLLGALTEAEAERLDELSVTNHEFAETLNAWEKELVDAYVNGELTGVALEQFKFFYLTSPLRRERVKFAEAFQIFAEKSATAQAGANDSAGRKAKQEGARWSFLLSVFTPRLVWHWGLGAAVIVLLIAGGLLVFENVRLRQHAAQAKASRDQLLPRELELQKEVEAQHSANSEAERELARLRGERERLQQELAKARSGGIHTPSQTEGFVSLVLAPPLRGAGQIPSLSLRPETQLVSFQLQLEAANYSAYCVALINPVNSKTLWRSVDLKPRKKGDGKAIGFSVPSALLKPQNYVLRLTAGSEIVSDYAFNVRK